MNEYTNLPNDAGLEYVFSVLSNKQKKLLLSILTEEKEILEPFLEQNEWARDRDQTLDSIISRIESP